MKIDKELVKQWIYDHISIQNPEGGIPLPMRFNTVQSLFYDSSRAFSLERWQDYVVKSRQVGFSTLNMCYIFACMALYPGFSALWVAEDMDNWKAIRRKRNKIVDSIIISIGSGVTKSSFIRNNDDETVMTNGSSLSLTFAGNDGSSTARGDTFNFAVLSESAYWNDAAIAYKSLIPGSELSKPSIVWDSTANGKVGDGEFFYKRVMSVLEGSMPGTVHFWPWWFELRYSIPATEEDIVNIKKTLTDNETNLINKHGLSYHQIKWRRMKIKDLNDDVSWFMEAYVETIDDAFISPGKSVFSVHILRKARRVIEKLLSKSVIDIRPYLEASQLGMGGRYDPLLQETLDPKLLNQARFYIPPDGKTRKNGPFSLGCDTSEGVVGGDPCSFSIVDRDARLACIVRGLYTPHEAACIASRLSALYNCSTTLEDQSSGPEISRIMRSSMSESDVLQLDLHPIMSIPIQSFLERNNVKTRPVLVGMLLGFVNKKLFKIEDPLLLREAETFIRRDDGSIGHSSGCHDDALFSLIMAFRGRERSLIESNIFDETEKYDSINSSGYAEQFSFLNQHEPNSDDRIKRDDHVRRLESRSKDRTKQNFGGRSMENPGFTDYF